MITVTFSTDLQSRTTDLDSVRNTPNNLDLSRLPSFNLIVATKKRHAVTLREMYKSSPFNHFLIRDADEESFSKTDDPIQSRKWIVGQNNYFLYFY